MTTVLNTIEALEKTSESLKTDVNLQWLAENFELILSMGEGLLQEHEKLTDEKDIKFFIQQHGGKNFAAPYLQIASWHRSLTEEWQQKIRALPFWTIEKNQWAKLAQLTFEQLEDWYQEIMELSQALSRKSDTSLLSPKLFDQTVAKFLPKSPKKTLALGKILEQEDYQVLLNIPEYDFTPETFLAFKVELRELVEGEAVTEDLFLPLEQRGFEPTLILSKMDRLVLENQKAMVKHQQELEEKDKQINILRSQVTDVKQQLSQSQYQFEQLSQKYHQQEQQLNQQQQQINQLLQRLIKLEQLTPLEAS